MKLTSLCSLAVDLDVTETVDDAKGIHAMLPKNQFSVSRSDYLVALFCSARTAWNMASWMFDSTKQPARSIKGFGPSGRSFVYFSAMLYWAG